VVNGKGFYIHTVEKGQTLYSISRLYNVSVPEVTETNGISASDLKQGMKIRVPQFSSSAPAPQAVVIDGKAYYLHKVQQGETLFSIGRQYNIAPAVVMSANPGTSANIALGSVLRIPVTEAEKPGAQPPSKTQAAPIAATRHIVTAGESLFSISRMYSIPVSELLEANPEAREGLRSGSEIIIPAKKKAPTYMYHKVAKGETYFSIAQKYGASTDKLQRENSFIRTPLKEGMFLKIERTEANKNLEQRFEDVSFHEVAKGETLFSLSKKYDIAPKKLKRMNPGIDIESMGIGSILMVPKQPYLIEEEDLMLQGPQAAAAQAEFSCAAVKSDSVRMVNIAMLLPMFLEANDTINNNAASISAQPRVLPQSAPFLEFYQGALMALDTLKKTGYSVNLAAYDTKRDTATLKKAMAKIDFRRTDLIIGPVYSNTFSVASRIAKHHGVPIASPLSSSISELAGNPCAIVVNTPQEFRIETAALYFASKPNTNFVIIHNGGVSDFTLMEAYKKVLFASCEDSALFAGMVFKELNFAEQGIQGVQDALSLISKNVIIIPSQNQAFVNNAVTQLYQFRTRYDIELLGLSNWENYDNIELDYLFGLDLQFGSNYYIDYSRADVKSFVAEYRRLFKSEPSRNVFHGYDMINYFVRAANLYPLFLCECLPEFTYQGLQSNMEFQNMDGGGIANSNVSLIKYARNLTIDKINFDGQAARKKFKAKSKADSAPIFEDLFMGN
jgi:LysM repeat protein/ABC-type branched-subunit amino acid transport system substrate-binding protein